MATRREDIQSIRRYFDEHVVPHCEKNGKRPRTFREHAITRPVGEPYAYYVGGCVVEAPAPETASYDDDGVTIEKRKRLTTVKGDTDTFTTVTIKVDGETIMKHTTR